MAEEFINDTEQTEDPFASFGGKAIKPTKTDDNPFKAFGGDAVTKKPPGNGSKNTSLPSATGGLLDPNFLQNTNSGNASFSPIADPKERQRVKDNAAHSMAIERAQQTKSTSVPREPQLSATAPKNTSIFDDISEALYIPAINKGFSDLVIKPAAGATDFIDRTIDKTYQAITGEKTPEFLRKKGAFHKLSEWVDKGFEERKKPTNIVSETAEGVVGTLPLIASLYTGQGELNIMAQAPQFFSKATKMLATTHGLNAFKDATDNGDDYTTSLGKATTGALQGGLTGMTIEAEMMVGGALGKGVAKQLAEKGLFKGGKAGEAILHALGVGTVFAGTSAGEDLLNGRDVDSHEAIKQFFTGLAFEAIPVGKALKDEAGERIEKSDINKNAAQTATLATASSNLNAESVMRTLVQTPKDQLLSINENIKDNHETLYANSIEQGARAYEEKNVNEKRALYADQLALKTQGDVKLIVDKLKDGGDELIKSIEESEELSQEQKIDLIDKIQDLSPKPIEEQVVQEAPVAEQGVASTENIEPQAETQPITNEQPKRNVTFKTARGSTYETTEDGGTVRNKAERSDVGHEGQKGIQEKSQKTYYISEADANVLGEIQSENSNKRAIVELPDGSIGIKYLNGKDAGKVEKRTVVKPEIEPQVGLMPLELWKDGTQSHFGNKITEINEQPIKSTVPEAEVLSEQTQSTTEPQVSETVVESGAEPKIEEPTGVDYFKIGDQEDFYHASPTKRVGRLKEGNAPQFGKGVYFSTNKDLVMDEFGKELTQVKLKVKKPLYTGTKEESAVKDLAAERWNKENLTYDEENEVYYDKNGRERQEVDFSDLGERLPVSYYSDAARELGYDVIIDKDSKTYDNEIVVLDPEKITYEEDLKPTIQKVEAKPASSKETTVDPIRQKAIDAIVNDVVIPEVPRKGEQSARFDFDMDTRDKLKAVRDIKAGNYDTAPAKKVIEKIMQWEADGEYPVIEGTGGRKGSAYRRYSAPAEEIAKFVEEAKQYKLAKEIPVEEVNKGLTDLGITHKDFETYEQFREETERGATGDAPDNGRTVGSSEKIVQPTGNDGASSKGEATTSDGTQGKPEQKEIKSVDTKAGDPLRQFASKVREGKISKLGGFKTGSLFDTAWDGSLEVVATSLEGGAKLVDAIEAGLKQIRETEFYKGLQDKKDFEQQYVSHMEKEAATESVIEPAKEKSNVSGSRHESTAEIREELGMDEYERISKSDIELNKQADEAMEKGYEINKLLNKLEKGDLPSDVEQIILRKYIVSLETNIDTNPSVENAIKLKRAIQLSDKEAGSDVARSLAARRGLIVKEDNLANFLLDEMNSTGNDLTQSEIDALKPKYQKGTEARKKYEAGVEATQKKAQPDKAEKELGTIRDSVKKERVRKTADEFRTERQEAIKRMRADLLKAAKGGYGAMSSIPLAPQLRAIAPHIATLVRSHVEEGFYELSDVVKRVHDDLKDIVDGITETDVRDLIAGEYRDKRATRNEITAQIHDLTTQAKLTKRLEDIETGLNPKTPEGKIAKSKQVEELKKQIKLAEDEAGITDQKSLKARQTYLKNQIEKLKKDLADGNFDKEPEPVKKLKLDEETEKYLDEYIAFQKETNLRRDKARYDRMNKAQKAWDITQQVLGLRRLVQTSIDMSMPFRQAVTVTLNPRHAAVTVKAFKNMFANTFNEKRYDRMMFDIENSPNYKAMVEDKVRFSTVENINNHDEDFRRSFAYKIPIVREPLMASERAATSFINTARYELYNKAKMRFEAQGLTRENSPETYTEMAKWVNNITGRGNLIKFLEESPQAQQILGNTFYGSRLMASRFNLLNPAYYVRMPRAVAIEAMKDMGAYASTLFVTGLALQAAGANITLNWNDPDFMKAKFGNTRYDLTGGMAQYIRTYMRILEAVENRVDPTVSKEQANKSGKFAATSLQQFFRFKLAPNTSYAVDAVTGKNAMGQDFDPYGLIRIYPMYADDMKKAWQDQGVTSLATILAPSIFGVGVQTYEPRTKWK